MGASEGLLESVPPSDPAVQLAAEKAVAALQQGSNSLFPSSSRPSGAASLQVLQDSSWAADRARTLACSCSLCFLCLPCGGGSGKASELAHLRALTTFHPASGWSAEPQETLVPCCLQRDFNEDGGVLFHLDLELVRGPANAVESKVVDVAMTSGEAGPCAEGQGLGVP